jgi:hypothetical protein
MGGILLRKNMQYQILNTKHPSYDFQELRRLELLYRGGSDIIKAANEFIPQNISEHPLAYKQRLREASYDNHLAEIVDYYVAALFSKDLSVIPQEGQADPFYELFQHNADLAGSSFHAVLAKCLTDAMVYGISYVAVDFPKPALSPSNRKEEELLGADRAYVYHIPNATVIDWRKTEDGKFQFLVIRTERQERLSPKDPRTNKVISFKVWEKTPSGVTYEIYETTVKNDKEPKPSDMIPLVAQGTTSFQNIPVLELDISDSLWIGNKIGTLCADHFRQKSSLNYAESKSLHASPYIKLGSELDQLGSSVGEDPNRGSRAVNQFANRGFMILGSKDDIGYLEPSGTAYALTNQQLSELSDAIHRVVHRMANSQKAFSQALGRSGESKSQDNQGTAILLSAYAYHVKQFTLEVYNTISEARQDQITWQCVGLDQFETVDRDLLLKEALAVSSIPIPSPTFQKTYLFKLAKHLVDASPEIQLEIRKEIAEAIDSSHLEKPEQEPTAQEQEEPEEDLNAE